MTKLCPGKKATFSISELWFAAFPAAILMGLCVLSACSSSNATHLAYIAGGQNSVFAYRVNNSSGSPTAVLGSPYLAGISPSSVVVHPSKHFGYVANQGENTISIFKIDATTGALTEVLPRTNAGISPVAMAMDSAGSFLFVANQGSNSVSVFSISSSNGALSEVSGSPYTVGSNPSGLTLTASGNFLFVPVPNFSSIYVFSVNAGVLTPVGAPVLVSDGVATLAVDPAGKFLYVPNPSTNTVTAYAIQSGGTLITVPGSPFATQTVPVAAAVNLAGTALYVANSGSSNISQFTINSTTGALTAFTTATQAAGTNPGFIVIDPDAKFVFVGNTGASSVSVLSLNSDGSLAVTSNTIQIGVPPRSVAVTQ
jgi:6-phosphogluconolactonase